jgi:hypothetical protein
VKVLRVVSAPRLRAGGALLFACALAACTAEILGGGGPVHTAGQGIDARPWSDAPVSPGCEPKTCAEAGWACGQFVTCGQVVDCAGEGLSCSDGEICMGGADGPTECVRGGQACEVCAAIPDCTGEPQTTRLTGRVVTPGRDAGDTANQVGVPNALVYILSTRNPGDLPAIPTGLPAGGASCDRCDDEGQQLGPFLNGAITDARGFFELEELIPVGEEIVLVVKVGKFRRATRITLPADGACDDIALPEQPSSNPESDNPARLPRHMGDGLAVNIPHIAVTTGVIDAMECVFEKIGIGHREFDNPGTDARIHLYRGQAVVDGELRFGGMRIDDTTPADATLYGSLSTMERYDMVVSDCKGQRWDSDFSDRNADGARVREYVNRGGRLFASHLSFSWLHQNGTAAYSPANPVATGLGPAATYQATAVSGGDLGTGVVALDRPRASPRIDSFAAWMAFEGVAPPPARQFDIRHPRSQATGLGSHAEEFVLCAGGDCPNETQQFSFNTPYGAPDDEACGRVAYSGFHVSPATGESPGSFPYKNAVFPQLCGDDLTDQEKVLLYMIFDLGACIGEPLPPECQPRTCAEVTLCGFVPDGCGGVIDCGDCTVD